MFLSIAKTNKCTSQQQLLHTYTAFRRLQCIFYSCHTFTLKVEATPTIKLITIFSKNIFVAFLLFVSVFALLNRRAIRFPIRIFLVVNAWQPKKIPSTIEAQKNYCCKEH